ncbi:hypothetical protein [Staphylococcus borealis]|nr:hypothetical protein [Staphylococcus borealis]MCQ9278671.1 hypothetical protein [Staphylococcus borealis]
MVFNKELVDRYLKIVDDENPIHSDIVPGQLIVEKVFSMLDQHWDRYKIKYLESIGINEFVGFEVVGKNKIIVSNKSGGVKLVIIRN